MAPEQLRRQTKARRVLLEKMWAPRPPAPLPCDLAALFESEDRVKSRTDEALFPLPPGGEQAHDMWKVSEAVKTTHSTVEEAECQKRMAVADRYLEWLTALESSYVQSQSIVHSRFAGHPTPRAQAPQTFSDFVEEAAEACFCFTDRLRSVEPPRSPATASSLEEPEHGEYPAGEELNLAVTCALMERCISRSGELAPLMSGLFNCVLQNVYSGVEPNTTCSLSSRINHFVGAVPHRRTNVSLAWENKCLAEEVKRAKDHLRLWAWVIWRNVVKGMKKVSGLLTGIESLTEKKRRKHLMLTTIERWKLHNHLQREESRYDLIDSKLRNFSQAYTTEGKVQEMIETYARREEEVKNLQECVAHYEREIAQLAEEVDRLMDRCRGNEERALETMKRYTKSVNRTNDLQMDNTGLKTSMVKMKEELASLRAASRAKQRPRHGHSSPTSDAK